MAKKKVEVVEDTVAEAPVQATKSKPTVNVYTYVGGGEDSPRVIDFMGLQKFVRGKPEEVTDQVVLRKVRNHPCFVEGEVEEEEIHDYDLKAKKEADAQRASDKKTQSIASRLASKWAGKSEEE